MPNFPFYGGHKQATTKFYFSIWTWILAVGFHRGLTNIWKSRWVRIIVVKTERMQIHFVLFKRRSRWRRVVGSLSPYCPSRSSAFEIEKPRGVDGCLLNWLRNSLIGRKQRVVVRGTCSEWSTVTSGTPQGSILGPLLFLLYLKDLSECISSTVKLYANDTNIYREIIDPIIDSQLHQEDLNQS